MCLYYYFYWEMSRIFTKKVYDSDMEINGVLLLIVKFFFPE